VSGPAAQDWYRRAFGRPYLEVYAHRDDLAAAREADFLARALDLEPGAWLLDAGCGAGRHARALAARGARTVGVDLSAALLAEARARGGGPVYVRADLRAQPFRASAFRHAVCLFTSFGYFDAEGDRAQLDELRRVLAPGGRLVLDFLNAPRVVATLVPESRREAGGRTVLERRRVRGGRVEKDVRVEVPGRPAELWTESVRLYGRAELEALLAGARFAVLAASGDLAGGPWSADADRLVLAAEAR
jgi:SAM-dependent methyltransferase